MGSKFKEQAITNMKGVISFEQDIKAGMKKGYLGIQISKDGRVWICIDGLALIRFNPNIGKGVTKNGEKEEG